MPLPALLGALAPVVGGAINAQSTNQQNFESRIWAQQMYEKQRADAIEFWNMNNDYNSPVNQMRRFQEAGLNPNLIYGQGNSGNASTPVKTPDIQRPSFDPPKWGSGLSQAMAEYQNTEIRQAQTDNLRTQNTVLLGEAALKAAQTIATKYSGEKTAFDLGVARDLRDTMVDTAKEQLRKLQADTSFQLGENERRTAMTGANLRESAERVLGMRLQRAQTKEEINRIKESIRAIQNDNELKRLDIELRRQGINPHDPVYLRVLGRVISSLTGSGPGLASRIDRAMDSRGNTFSKIMYGLFGDK